PAINTFIFFFAGVAVAIAILDHRTAPSLNVSFDRQLLTRFVILLLLLPISYQLARGIMDATPLRYEDADMLPVIRIMGQRFVSGQWQHVYDPIPGIWNGIRPIYLPGLWIPFASSLIFHFDPRWITVCGIWLSVIVFLLPRMRSRPDHFLLLACMLSLLVFLHVDADNSVIELSEEGPVFFYYSFLVLAIVLRNPWVLGCAIALCLTSRYAFIGWIPFAIIIAVWQRQYRLLLRSSLTAAAVCVILLAPFGTRPLLEHLHLHRDYIAHAARVWHDNPEFYTDGLGFAKFFGPQHIRLQHAILVAGSFIVPLLLLPVVRKRTVAFNAVLLAGLQLTLTFFYSFLDVTYQYLYYTPVFVTLCIAAIALSGESRIRE
ncbi:MAG TPA: hypothetical protein VGC95_06115, partial [Chitinophagaceae bacterium]